MKKKGARTLARLKKAQPPNTPSEAKKSSRWHDEYGGMIERMERAKRAERWLRAQLETIRPNPMPSAMCETLLSISLSVAERGPLAQANPEYAAALRAASCNVLSRVMLQSAATMLRSMAQPDPPGTPHETIQGVFSKGPFPIKCPSNEKESVKPVKSTISLDDILHPIKKS
jgi:hypothetical protein